MIQALARVQLVQRVCFVSSCPLRHAGCKKNIRTRFRSLDRHAGCALLALQLMAKNSSVTEAVRTRQKHAYSTHAHTYGRNHSIRRHIDGHRETEKSHPQGSFTATIVADPRGGPRISPMCCNPQPLRAVSYSANHRELCSDGDTPLPDCARCFWRESRTLYRAATPERSSREGDGTDQHRGFNANPEKGPQPSLTGTSQAAKQQARACSTPAHWRLRPWCGRRRQPSPRRSGSGPCRTWRQYR